MVRLIFVPVILAAMVLPLYSPVVNVLPVVETDSVAGTGDVADDAAIWIHPVDRELSRVIGHSKDSGGGLHVYNLAGEEVQFVEIGKVGNLDVGYNFPLGGVYVDLVCAVNRSEDTLCVYRVDPVTGLLEDAAARVIEAGIIVYGSCMYHSPVSDKFYCFINAKSGDVEQWELIDDGSGRVDAVLVRSFDVGDQVEGCVADDAYGTFYIGEEDVGLWRYGAEPDAGSDRVLVEYTTKIDPDSHLASQVEGMAIYYCQDGTGYLIASSQGEGDSGHRLASTFAVYRREGDNDYIGSFAIVDDDTSGIDGCSVTDGIDVTNMDLGGVFPYGMFVAHDSSNRGGTSTNYKYVPWESIAGAFSPALKIDTGWNRRMLRGDFNGDHIINEIDFAVFSDAWLSEYGDSEWNGSCDLSVPPDGKIDFWDLMLFVDLWLKVP